MEGADKSEVDAVVVDAAPAPTCATCVEKSAVAAPTCAAGVAKSEVGAAAAGAAPTRGTDKRPHPDLDMFPVAIVCLATDLEHDNGLASTAIYVFQSSHTDLPCAAFRA